MPVNRNTDSTARKTSADTTEHSSHGPDLNAPEIRSQLERILVSAPFRNSKRYPALLRYVVEKHLDGKSSELKERTIGIDVFGRDPYYDPGVDPVVRISAGEVRKRLAQYYQETAEAAELRIDLPVGSYQPEFVARMALPVTVPSPVVSASSSQRFLNRYPKFAVACLAAMMVLLGVAAYQLTRKPAALDLFWRPVLQQGNSVMLCLGHTSMDNSPQPDRPKDTHERAVAWWDAATMARVAGLLQSKGATVRLFNEDEATFADFQQRPAVLIGAFNDRWTMEWMSHQRFTFQHQGAISWIADRDRPSFRDWQVDLSRKDAQGNLAIPQDYAIISRISNPRTGFITVTAAGLWGYGTLSSGRFLTDPKYLADLASQNHIRLDQGDVQIVIGAEVIQGKPGPPRVLAVSSR